MQEMVIVSDYAGEVFGRKVAERLLVPYVHVDMKNFPDGEADIQISENIRGRDVFYVCPFYPDPMRRFTEIALTNSALKYSSAGRLVDVPTYLGFMKKDWKDRPRVPISIRDVAIMMEQYANRVLTIDMHAPQNESAFRIPIDHLDGTVLYADHIKNHYNLDEIRIATPDGGGVKRVRKLAERTDQKKIAIVYKIRDPVTGETASEEVIGDVEGKIVIFLDDQAITIDSLNGAANNVMERGAKSVVAYCTHGVMAKKNGRTAEQRLTDSLIEKLYLTDTISRTDSYYANNPKIGVISAVDLVSKAIKGVHNNESISVLFR